MVKESIKIIDLNTNEETVREMTNAEHTQYKADQKLNEQKIIEAEAKAVAKSALLDKLGITEDEAKLLLS